ncbi:MAG TPA: ribosome silencing factor [Candidatus Fimimonas merdipullorum]|uniref:Ribosomal silencing factor RsfS n=1 Tax=Candidatus Fimimonas merdipullorum TaxID=2840822 RepID=A0A9D1MW78_9BACT|nr:ribosome silencing factor [Candidatus Fimimonas merdipullorum]
MNDTVKTICKTLAEKSAEDIRVIEVRGVSDITDYFVVCSGRSAPQVKALCEHLEETMEKQNRFALHKDGLREGKWVAVDYGDVIVHVFHKDVRSVYALDVLWDHGGNVTRYE